MKQNSDNEYCKKTTKGSDKDNSLNLDRYKLFTNNIKSADVECKYKVIKSKWGIVLKPTSKEAILDPQFKKILFEYPSKNNGGRSLYISCFGTATGAPSPIFNSIHDIFVSKNKCNGKLSHCEAQMTKSRGDKENFCVKNYTVHPTDIQYMNINQIVTDYIQSVSQALELELDSYTIKKLTLLLVNEGFPKLECINLEGFKVIDDDPGDPDAEKLNWDSGFYINPKSSGFYINPK